LFGPEALVVFEPIHRGLHRIGFELTGNGAPRLVPHDQSCIREHIEMLHDRGQRHREWPRQLADRKAVLLAEPGQQGAPRRVG